MNKEMKKAIIKEEIIKILEKLLEESIENIKEGVLKTWKENCADQILELFQTHNQDLIEEMIKLSDDIEAKYETPDINEWRAFKHFRNTMRDKFKHQKPLRN